MELPKVLIIGVPFNNNTGGGITVSNLFKGWDKTKLAVACPGVLISSNIDTEICDKYYQIGFGEQKWFFPFNLLQRKYISGPIQFTKKSNEELSIKKSKLREKIIMNFLFPLLHYTGLIHIISKINLSVDFCNWLNDYNPDIIYYQTATRNGILFCLSLQSYLKKPLVFHMMDDWPSVITDKGFLKKYWRRKIDREFRILLDRATILMSISDEMAQEYKIRYNKEFITFHNSINMDFWKKYQKSNYELRKNITILYAGRIGLGINTSLELIAKAIERVNSELNISIKFILQTQTKPLWINNFKSVSHIDFVPYNELPKVFSEADFLLLPYDFSPKSIKFIQYSMPTKAPEYMVSGTPIIIFAPETTAIARNARKNGWAKVVSRNNIEVISEAIKHLIESKELRKKIATNAITMSEEKYNSNIVANQFQKVIYSTVKLQ